MSPEDQHYYEVYNELFATEGWKQFIEDIKQIPEQFNIRTLKTPEEFHKTQGRLEVTDHIANFQSHIELAAEMADQSDETEEDYINGL